MKIVVSAIVLVALATAASAQEVYHSAHPVDDVRDCLIEEEADALGMTPTVIPVGKGWRIGVPGMLLANSKDHVLLRPSPDGGTMIEDHGLLGHDQEILVKNDFKDCKALSDHR